MRVNREAALRSLSMVSAGISDQGIVEQSDCFIFRGGRVSTYNEEIACEGNSPFGEDVEGAVKAASLLSILVKLPDDEIDVSTSDSELLIKAKRRKSGVYREADILIAPDLIQLPTKWKKLDDRFLDALNAVKDCAGSDTDKFYTTCVHITPEWVEACDNYQMARHKISVPITRKMLVRQKSINPMTSLGLNKIGETKTWLHFKNDETGFIYSLRRYLEDYLDLSPYFESAGDEIRFPTSLDEVAARAEVFTEKSDANYVKVHLRTDRVLIEGSGANGWYREEKRAIYQGPSVVFLILPKVLARLGSRSGSFSIGNGRLVADLGHFCYATRIGIVE